MTEAERQQGEVWWPHDSFMHHRRGETCPCGTLHCRRCGGVEHKNVWTDRVQTWCEECRLETVP